MFRYLNLDQSGGFINPKAKNVILIATMAACLKHTSLEQQEKTSTHGGTKVHLRICMQVYPLSTKL